MRTILSAGDTAPIISAIDIWDNKVSIPTVDKWLYLSFHRFAACPFCNLRTNELIRNHSLLKEYNIEVISIWPSRKENMLQYAGSEQPPFPMLSDPSKSIYAAYGVTRSSLAGGARLLLHPQLMFNAIKNRRKNIDMDADPMLMPASFLVDTQGIIRMAYYGKHFGDHPAIESIIEHKQAE